MRKIPAAKFHLCIMLMVFSIFNLFLMLHFVNDTRNYTSQEIFVISWIAIIEIAVSMILWKKMAKELLSPFTVVFFTTVVFGIGQVFGWALGMDMDYYDLQTYIPTIGMHYVGDSLLYSLDGIILFLMGGAIAYTGVHRPGLMIKETEKNKIDKEAMRLVSTFLLLVSVPAFLLNSRNVLGAVLMSGYSGMYTELNSYSQAEQFLPLLAGWLPIALLMKYALHCNTRKDYSNLAVIGMVIYIALNLFLGARSGVVMLALAFLITKHFLGTPFTKRKVIPTAIIGYIGIGFLNAVRNIRLMSNRSILDVLDAFSVSSVIGSFIGELGWSMSSLAWTMRLIHAGEPFRYGTSYLYAITAIIPNLGFWKEHPAVKANLGRWMQSLLGRTTGLGYTFIAETYANFAWFGLIAMFFFGVLLGKIMGSVTRDTAKYNYKATMVMIMIISVLLKSFVRSTFSSIMRQLVFTVILITTMISLTAKHIANRQKVSVTK